MLPNEGEMNSIRLQVVGYLRYHPSLCDGKTGVAETANKSADVADIPTRRRVSLAVSATLGFLSHRERCYYKKAKADLP